MRDFVYAITNSWFPGLTKLGSTSDVQRRFCELSSVLPGKSELVWSRCVDDAYATEQAVRKILSAFSISGSQDWFSCPSSFVVVQFEIYIENNGSDDPLQTVLDGMPVAKSTKVNSLKELGEYCRRRRKSAGFTIRDFAGMCGVGVRFVSEFERGKGTCQFDMCQRIAAMIGVDLYAVSRSQD